MFVYMGIDQSYTSSGCCVIENGITTYVGTISSDATEDFFDRAWYVAQEIIKLVECYNPTYIFMEDLAFSSIGNATRQLGGLQYVIVTSIRKQLNREVTLVPPTTLKKFATGKGNSKKDEMYISLPSDVKDLLTAKKFKKTKGLGDVVDAYWLAMYGANKINVATIVEK